MYMFCTTFRELAIPSENGTAYENDRVNPRSVFVLHLTISFITSKKASCRGQNRWSSLAVTASRHRHHYHGDKADLHHKYDGS